MIEKAEVLLVDLSNLIWRGFHGYSMLNEPEEDPISHLIGPLKILISMMQKNKKAEIYFAVDGLEPYKKENPEYKGQRHKTEYDLRMIQEAKDMLKMIPAFWCWHNDFEADDIIATFAKNESKKDFLIKILSSDKDMWALIQDSRVLCVGNKGEMVDSNKVEEKLGVPPKKVELYKAFFGDPSDNIKGVPRVRKKIFIPLLLKCENVEEVYGKIDKFKQNSKLSDNEFQKIKDYKEQAFINEDLVKLNRDVDYYELFFEGKRMDLKEKLHSLGFIEITKQVEVFFWRRREEIKKQVIKQVLKEM